MPKHVHKLMAGLLAVGLVCGVLWIVYAPAHWLTPFAAAVTVDDHPARADIYIGNPTQNEAEAIAFVHVAGVGDYFLDFENETFRESSSEEFIRFKRGVWTFAVMNRGRFATPPPFRRVNEFHFQTSSGHTVTVQF